MDAPGSDRAIFRHNLELMEQAKDLLNSLINRTSSGDIRNSLTNANIHLLIADSKMQEIKAEVLGDGE